MSIVFGQKKHLKGFANNRKALNSFPVIREIRETLSSLISEKKREEWLLRQ